MLVRLKHAVLFEGVVRKDAMDLIAVNPTEHKRATITHFLLIEGEFWMEFY